MGEERAGSVSDRRGSVSDRRKSVSGWRGVYNGIMSTDSPPPTNHQPPHGPPQGLPPVKAPSARFIVQLFLIPGLIVTGLVFVWVFGSLIVSSSNTPESYLQKLDSSNPDIRWRAAHDLAQVLKRPESVELASDVDFALEVAERLKKAWRDLEQAEDEAMGELKAKFDAIEADQSLPSREEKDKKRTELGLASWAKLRPQRDLLTFYTSCVGDFLAPVGVNALTMIAMKDKGGDLKGLSLRRRQAVFALANLGSNLQQRYHGKTTQADTKPLTAAQKQHILDRLEKASVGKSDRARIAHGARNILTGKEPSRVDQALEVCARSNDVFLRAEVAFALTFWDGDRVEPTLLLLSRDDGHGLRIEISDTD